MNKSNLYFTLAGKTAILFFCLAFLFNSPAAAKHKSRIVINADLGRYEISRHIYGHFSEHLGKCIYGGFWVGENSSSSEYPGNKK
jgi:alpha-L-arabinofuranosidase